jgi:hypothetical protein
MEISIKQNFINKHLFVVEFPSTHYVFPFVPGTKRQKVFWCEGELEAVDCETAKERITRIHSAIMDEMEACGI